MVKNSLVLGLFLFVILINIYSTSALQYDCNLVPAGSCNQANTVMRLSDINNAHGEIYNGAGGYGYVVCCNFPGNRACLPDESNVIITLSGNTNAHAEIRSQSSYNTNICFNQSLKCVNVAAPCPGSHPIDLISLVTINNSHISNFTYPFYPIKICCNNSDERPPTESCEDQGGRVCILPKVCTDGTYSPTLNDSQGVCCQINCCTPDANYCQNHGIQCGQTTNNCGQPINCGLLTQTCTASVGGCTTPGTQTCSSGTYGSCVADDDPTKTLDEACTLAYGAGYECGAASSCGTNYICKTCPPSGRPSDVQCNLTTGRCYEPPPAPCSFTSVYWNKATAVGGDLVSLIVQGSASCNGLSVSFEIWEDDGILGDDTLVSLGGTNPTPATMSGGVVVKSWNAQYFVDSDGSNPEDEYYFKATIAVIGTQNSGFGGGIGTLTVSAPVIPPVNFCVDTPIVTCADYNITTCGTDSCNVACDSIAGGCGGSCPGPNYKDNAQCFWNASAGPSGSCGVTFETFSCPQTECGNGIQEIGEECDGNSFRKPDGSGNFTCQDYGFSGGSLTCTSCNISTISCTGYNCVADAKVQFRNESCDPLPPPIGNLTRYDNDTGEIIGLWSCVDLGYTGGQLSCDNSCNFKGCTIDTGGLGVLLGNCSYNTGDVIDCNDPRSNGLYEASWTGDWDWGANNETTNATCQAKHGVGTCIFDEGGWHYYPQGSTDWANCEAGGQNTIECPAQIRLPFFGNLQFIITLLVITLIYGMMRLDKGKK